MLSRAQRDAFDRLGFVRLPGLLPEGTVSAMGASLWRHLAEHHGILRDDPSTWSIPRPSNLKALTRAGAFAGMASPAVTAVCDELFGPAGWSRPPHWGQPLVYFPQSGIRWEVPHRHWHLDIPVAGTGRGLPGVRLFALLEPVQARGGGTVAVTGSHRLAQIAAGDSGRSEALSSQQVRRIFARSSPWMRELLSRPEQPDRRARFMNAPHTERGIPLQVAELTGDAGDVIVMDLRLLHAIAPNCTDHPRVVIGQAIFRKPVS